MKMSEIAALGPLNEIGYTVIRDLIPAWMVGRWYTALVESRLPWTQIIRNCEREDDYDLYNQEHEITYNHALALSAYAQGSFCFSFKRVQPTSYTAGSIVDDIYEYFSSSAFISTLSSLSGKRLSHLGPFYVSRFDKGDFLTTHTDSGAALGIAFNITPYWNANHGGLTIILDSDRKVARVLEPEAGVAFIFDTSFQQVPHFVSMVTCDAKKKRLAVIARYH